MFCFLHYLYIYTYHIVCYIVLYLIVQLIVLYVELFSYSLLIEFALFIQLFNNHYCIQSVLLYDAELQAIHVFIHYNLIQ